MKSWHAISLIVLVWAGIYLSHLGREELRGEEARRIIPGQEMLKNGDWIVPRMGGEIYSNKPPMINWLVAASFAVTGHQSEFTARLPSAIALLAFGIITFIIFRPRMGNNFAACIPIVFFTTIAMIDKGRTIEIEAVFISLFGIACYLWAKGWANQRSPWLIWPLPYILLGL